MKNFTDEEKSALTFTIAVISTTSSLFWLVTASCIKYYISSLHCSTRGTIFLDCILYGYSAFFGLSIFQFIPMESSKNYTKSFALLYGWFSFAMLLFSGLNYEEIKDECIIGRIFTVMWIIQCVVHYSLKIFFFLGYKGLFNFIGIYGNKMRNLLDTKEPRIPSNTEIVVSLEDLDRYTQRKTVEYRDSIAPYIDSIN